jgi:hypothetical protein
MQTYKELINLIVVSFLRYQKLEQERVQTEHQFNMQRMALENDRRREEREHEMNMLRMIMGPQPLSSFTLPNVHSQYLPSAVPCDDSCTRSSHCSDIEGNKQFYYPL